MLLFTDSSENGDVLVKSFSCSKDKGLKRLIFDEQIFNCGMKLIYAIPKYLVHWFILRLKIFGLSNMKAFHSAV